MPRRTAPLRESRYRGHDRREARNRPRAQVVSVREAARQDDGVGAAKVRVLVPDQLGLLRQDVAGCVPGVAVGIRTRKHDNSEFHELRRWV